MSNAESPTVAEIEELIEAAETLGRSDEPTIHLARAYLAEVSAHAETRERQAQELSNEVDCTAWKAVIKYAYADGGDGAQNIYNITSHYIKMRTERDALREQLAQAQARIDALEDSMNPQDVCDIDAALRAKQEPPPAASRPAESPSSDASAFPGGRE